MSPLRIIVAGTVAQYPVGGIAWDYLQYVIGLAGLGHDVFYHEDTSCWPYHPHENRMTDDARYSAGFLINFFQRYAPDLAEHWHYLHLHDASCGMSRRAFNAVAGTAGLFINIRGASFFRRFVAALSQSFYPYRSWLQPDRAQRASALVR